MPDSALQRQEVYYSGHVQGVGFRYSTVHVAHNHAVTGWVRNVPDGRVQLVVEGQRAVIDTFLADLAGRMSGYIRDMQSHSQPATGEFLDFRIRS